MNRTPTLHLKRVTITPHYRPQVLYNIHTLWSLLFSIFSNWAHTKYFCGQSFEPLHLLDLDKDNLISTLKVLSLLLCKACVNSEFSAFVFIFNLCLILFEWSESRGKGEEQEIYLLSFCVFQLFYESVLPSSAPLITAGGRFSGLQRCGSWTRFDAVHR